VTQIIEMVVLNFPICSISHVFQVLKGVPDRPEVVLVRLREIKSKIDKKLVAQDRSKNTISVKDVVRVLEGPCKVYCPVLLCSSL